MAFQVFNSFEYHFLFGENAIQGSFTDSSRMYMLQGVMAQQEWRAGELLHRLLDFLKPYLTHPYQVHT